MNIFAIKQKKLRFFLLYGKNVHMLIARYLKEPIRRDLEDKMVFMSGPRQVGKTTLAKTFLKQKDDRYYNWDRREDRRAILPARWPAVKSTIVLDELHKYRHWKGWIKGEYDTHGDRIRFLITGSARLDIYRKGGDSLQGRYHSHRLHGLSVGELRHTPLNLEPGKEIEFPGKTDQDALSSLFKYGPFPEPFLKQNERSLRRWRRERLDRFFKEDVRELENVRDLSSMELLVDLLEDRVGGLISLQSLREDLEVSHRAVSHWVEILERLYLCFRIAPFAHSKVRSLKKAAKLFFWDYSSVPKEGPRFENLVACHLLKLKHALEDQEGYDMGLYYLRDASKREVDFLVTKDKKPWFAVECKMTSRKVNPALNYFGQRLNIPYLYQLTLKPGDDTLDSNVRVMPAGKFLAALP
ncbi:MAG: ATP-binding protein [Thermoplasmata archaeon]|nr:MAG: ATP-binding protein [Thermoplasmata archaeon]